MHLQANIRWAWMKIKLNKSRSISIVKGVLRDTEFCIGDDPMSECPSSLSNAWADGRMQALKDKEKVQ